MHKLKYNVMMHLVRTHVPSKKDQDRSDRDLADESLKALLRLAICILEDLITDLQEVLAPLDGCGNLLSGVGNGPAHLGCDL